MNAQDVNGSVFMLEKARVADLVDDVTQIIQRVPYIEVAPVRYFSVGLLSELADASDRLASTVAKLQEKINGKQAA